MNMPAGQQGKRAFLGEFLQEPPWLRWHKLLKRLDPESTILTFNYDTGERYLSVDDLF